MMIKTQKYLILFTIFLFSLSACSVIAPSRLVYTQPEPMHANLQGHDDGDYFLALAISSGGSRSAVWSAAVLKELFDQVKLPDGRSILDEVDYISSVSAGSLSSAYYCMKKPAGNTRNEDEYRKFFDDFVKDMGRNIEGNLFMKPRLWYRLFVTSIEKTYFLKKDFDRYYFSGLTFDYLNRRSIKGEAPSLIINGTVLDSGEKFLFTTLPRSNFQADLKILKKLENLESAGMAKSNVSLNEDIYSMTFAEDIGISISEMEVSWAVASSIGAPAIFGPIILKDRSDTESGGTYYHISDGGLTDSLGLETVIQLLSSRMSTKRRKYRGGMVIVIDAGHRIDPRDSALTKNLGGKEMAARTEEIYTGRVKYLTYVTVILAQKDPGFREIDFVYISPYMAEDPEIIKKVKNTPTRFKIDKESVRNLEEAAKVVVGIVKDEIIDNFEGE